MTESIYEGWSRQNLIAARDEFAVSLDRCAVDLHRHREAIEEIDAAILAQDQPLTFLYRNYRGEIATRRVIPYEIRFGSSQWHTKPQWLLRAKDLDKDELREFAFADIQMAGDVNEMRKAGDAALHAMRLLHGDSAVHAMPLQTRLALVSAFDSLEAALRGFPKPETGDDSGGKGES